MCRTQIMSLLNGGSVKLLYETCFKVECLLLDILLSSDGEVFDYLLILLSTFSFIYIYMLPVLIILLLPR